MTGSRDFKRLVRQRMAETGESYTVARSHFDAPPKNARSRSARPGRAVPTTVGAFKEQVYARIRTEDLAPHLEQQYGVRVSLTAELDTGVYRVDRKGGPSWIARIFPAVRLLDVVRGDAEVLEHLAAIAFPAERTADPEPVSILAGQPVLVTDYVPGSNRRSDASEETMRSLGTTLGRLHALPEGPTACQRRAGSWHHLSPNGGGRRSDVQILLTLLRDAETRLTDADRTLLPDLRGALEALDDLEDLPTALIHPDPCGANLISVDGEDGVLVDWTGAGLGPRVVSFANLLGSVTVLGHVDAAVAGYRLHASLEAAELDRLEAALVGFPLILDCWMLLFHSAPLTEVLRRLATHRQRAAALAGRARSAFGAPLDASADRVTEGDQARLF